MRRKRYRGSITIFAALAIMLVAQLLFTLIEGARRVEFHKVIQMNTDSVLESVFADYCSPLWEQYRILGMTADNMEGSLSFNNRMAQIRKLTLKNLGQSGQEENRLSGMSLFHTEMTDVDTDSYLLMTDGEGAVFEQVVSAYMKENLAFELAKGIYNDYESIKESQNQFGDGSDKIGGALDALEKAKESSEDASQIQMYKASQAGSLEIGMLKSSGQNGSNPEAEISKEDNPLTIVTEARKKGSLGMVLPEEAHLSGVAFAYEERVSRRPLMRGTAEIPKEEDWYDKTLFTQYVCNYMSSYTTPIPDHALQYELEYLIGGKDNDADNLRATVNRLLVIREGLNMASLMAMPDKQTEAETLAITLAGVSVNPLIIEAVKYGILAAWAYVESVLDVRTLLDGGKISLVKSDATWTSTIDNFPTLLSGWSKAKSCENGGLDYKQHGAILLFFENSRKLAMRAMDVEEATVRRMEDYASFRMDHVVCEMEIQAIYEYHPVFMVFVSMVKNAADRNRMIGTSNYSYFRGKEDV